MTKFDTKYAAVAEFAAQNVVDSIHAMDHINRVYNYAMDIARHENGVNIDVLAVACLLHDIGQKEQFEDRKKDHAAIGAEKAFAWLVQNGHSTDFASAVRDCVATHRFRTGNPPVSIEAKILYDADKVDVCGAVGMARNLMYVGHMMWPLESFLDEFKFKTEKVFMTLLTKRGTELAEKRKSAAQAFYGAMQAELKEYN